MSEQYFYNGEQMEAADAADLMLADLYSLREENKKLHKAMTGWDSFAWKDGEYIDEIQEYFDGILKGEDSA